MEVPPAIYLLIGYPGTGKYTVGKALVGQIEAAGGSALLVDNHYLNNPIFRLIATDGKAPISDEVWDRVTEFRDVVLRTIETLSPTDRSFIFTNWIAEGESGADAYLARLKAIAETRHSRFVCVRLTCELAALKERVPRPDRVERMKWVDADAVAALTERHRVYEPAGSCITIDNTDLSPEKCARQILSQVDLTGARAGS